MAGNAARHDAEINRRDGAWQIGRRTTAGIATMATVPQLTLIARRPKTRKPSRLSSKIPAVARERRATNRLMAEVIGADVGRLR